jgi:anti-sigma B factor antagonist
MEWTSSEENGILKIALDGRLVAACVDDMQEALLPQVERTPNVVLDLTKMVHIDSSGLGLLVHLLQKANEKGGTVKIACLQPHPRVVFDITKVYRVFKIYDTVEEALASFSA